MKINKNKMIAYALLLSFGLGYIDANAIKNNEKLIDINNNIKTTLPEGWSKVGNMPELRPGAGIIAVDKKIYVVGGAVNDDDSSAEVKSYNTENNTWETKDSYPYEYGIGYAILEYYNGEIYALSGYDADMGGKLYDVRSYNIANNTWSLKSSRMHNGFYFNADTVVIDDKAYLMCGEYPSGGGMNLFHIYDFTKNEWIEKYDDNHIERVSASVTAVNGKIYIVGGGTYHDKGYSNEVVEGLYNRMDMYDPVEDTWTQLKVPNYEGEYIKGTVIDGKIYYTGGKNTVSGKYTVEMYDPTKDSWKTIAECPVPMGNREQVVVDNKIYLLGGGVTTEIHSFEIPEEKIEPEVKTFGADIYIKPSTFLSVSLNTNSVMFEDFDGIDNTIKANALEMSVTSALPYEINASLAVPIQNADKSKTINPAILSIKVNDEDEYKTFTSVESPIRLKDTQSNGDVNVHGIDLKLNTSIPYEIDVYKTVLNLEVKQK